VTDVLAERGTSTASVDSAQVGAGPQTVSLVAVVGTDYHRFDRLIGWIDDWLRRQHPAPRAVVQHGRSAPPVRAEGQSLIAHSTLQELMASATVVITHGGPATIIEARRLGRRPIVVPRDPTLHEHVDGHQQRFSRWLAAQDLVTLCETERELMSALDAAVADPTAYLLSTEASPGGAVASVNASPTEAAVARVGEILDVLIAGKPGRRARRSLRARRDA